MSKRHRAPRKTQIPLGYTLLFTVFLVFAVISWVFAFRATPAAPEVACNIPQAGENVPSTNLLGTAPAPPQEILTRVLNSSTEPGIAQVVASQLTELGFQRNENIKFDNDSLSSAEGINCFGQLRYGAASIKDAATLHALFPCFELIHDSRPDGSIDVVLGNGFKELETPEVVIDTMTALNEGKSVDLDALSRVTSEKLLLISQNTDIAEYAFKFVADGPSRSYSPA